MPELELTISAIEAETPLIRTLHLRAPAGSSLPAFTPGAHLQVSVPGLADARCYSLVSFDADAAAFEAPLAYRLGVRLEDASRGGSRYMHGLAVGDTVKVSGPKNDFPLHAAEAGERPIVLIAGGIGITPIAAMAASLQASGRAFELHYSGRSRDQLAFVDELAALAGNAFFVHADDDPASRLDLGALLDGLDTAQHLYVCGPKGMIDALIEGAKTRGWPSERVHFELFAAAAPVAGDQAFEVELAQSGKVLLIPADKTILDVMEAEGCDPMYDCKRGECGVCTATVLEGVPDHRDYFLSDAEKAGGKLIQICISRAKTPRLVLDL
ncbi:vanillate O-demethylase oxidoreductase [Azoarcus olearius]|uniref:PDR/VanB family oxidoreductase n=1 Tax=Azoarcus sp. (strain BH72) TaxID=418699 RepID=UPI00080615EA|nr:PDR/VanB family oxidoreductase [Azoarcus olearius]ANQ85174.1 vanillate O-demethylase oxidoreductase [Azoarcus olearius]